MHSKQNGLPEEMISWHNRCWGALCLLLIYYLLPAITRDLWSPDEVRYAEISREMVASGEWIVPRLLGLRYFEKPVGGYWFNSLAQCLWGSSALGVRASSLLSTVLTCLLIFRCARCLGLTSSYRWFSTYTYASMLLICGLGSYSVLDPQLNFWLSFVLWTGCEQFSRKKEKGGYRFAVFMGIGIGMAFLTKGFLGIVLPSLTLGPLLLFRRYRELFQAKYFFLVLFVALILSLPWALSIHLKEPDYWSYFFWQERVHRFLSRQAEHAAPPWFFLPIIAVGAMPWTSLLCGAIYQRISSWYQGSQSTSLVEGYLWSCFFFPLIFFSVCRGKLLTYSLPLFVPITLLMASYWSSLRADQKVLWRGRVALTNIFFASVLLALVIWKPEWLDHFHCFTPDFKINPKLRYVRCTIGAGWLLPNLVLYAWRHRKVEWLAACSLALGVLLAEAAIPDWVRLYKQPTRFLSQHVQANQPEAIWICNDPNLSVALGWYTQHAQIYLLGSVVGELRYGLSYPDAQSRAIDWKSLSSFVLERKGKRIFYWIYGEEAYSRLRADLPHAELIAHKGRIWLFSTLK